MSGAVQQPGGKSWSSKQIGEWAAQAACRSEHVNPDWWFPKQLGPRPNSRHQWTPDAVSALRVCASCPVLDECLTHALTTGEADGIWGGKFPDERRKLTREPQPITHGTEAGYKRHRRRNEDPCRACCEAASRASRTRKDRMRSRIRLGVAL